MGLGKHTLPIVGCSFDALVSNRPESVSSLASSTCHNIYSASRNVRSRPFSRCIFTKQLHSHRTSLPETSAVQSISGAAWSCASLYMSHLTSTSNLSPRGFRSAMLSVERMPMTSSSCMRVCHFLLRLPCGKLVRCRYKACRSCACMPSKGFQHWCEAAALPHEAP